MANIPIDPSPLMDWSSRTAMDTVVPATLGTGGIVPLAPSFRDPGGFLFRDADGKLLRQVNQRSARDYDRFMTSGLYDELVRDGLLVEHAEVDHLRRHSEQAYRVLQPRELAFISYPYEWCFSAYQAAADLTLEIQSRALRNGMTLKDASAFNVQFEGARPIFIDSLSFETYREGRPWAAYGQFCRHFLAPLALMALVDVDLAKLTEVFLDGVPLGLASRMLPKRSLAATGLLLHLHLHARMIDRHAGSDVSARRKAASSVSVTHQALGQLVGSLRKTIDRLRPRGNATEWSDYYQTCEYTDSAAEAKRALVGQYLDTVRPPSVWDLGANTGHYAELAWRRGATVLAFDADAGCVERLFQRARRDSLGILTLRQDLTNPSPSVGWAHRERDSLIARGPTDLVMSLALIHHLAISNNVPLPSIADFLRRIGRHLIIEWVPKEDSQCQRLLAGREDVFDNYTREGFEAAFAHHFRLLKCDPLPGSSRVLYLMEGRL